MSGLWYKAQGLQCRAEGLGCKVLGSERSAGQVAQTWVLSRLRSQTEANSPMAASAASNVSTEEISAARLST